MSARHASPNEHLASATAQASYRDYDKPGIDRVRTFYRNNHQQQTYAFVAAKKERWLGFTERAMTPWEGLDFLNTLVDESDPDTELPQIMHLLQTAEAIRADGHPDWFVLTGFIHDLGKVLCLFGEPQWAVVGDTFPVGCKPSDKIVYPEFFALSPDAQDAHDNTEYGICSPHCGLDNVHLSWGHDEYLYHLLKPYLPEPALYMIRYHSF
jgi:inositol oxygenase